MGSRFEQDEAYLSGSACTGCIDKTCREQDAACLADAQCASLIEEARNAGSPLIASRTYVSGLARAKWAFELADKQASWVKLRTSLTQCVRDHCSVECRVGRKLACVGRFEYPASYPSTATLRFRILAEQDLQGLADWSVQACAPGSDCDRIMGTSTTDKEGFAAIAIDFAHITPLTRSLSEFDGTVELKGGGDYSPRVLQQSAPYLDGHFARWFFATRAKSRKNQELRGLPTLAGDLGSLDIQVLDCDCWMAWGITLEIWRYGTQGYQRCDSCTVTYPDDDGNPDPALSSFIPSSKNSAVALLHPGEYMVKARDAQSGRLISVLQRIHIRTGYENSAILLPASQSQFDQYSTH
jgi:hypothetical protein